LVGGRSADVRLLDGGPDTYLIRHPALSSFCGWMRDCLVADQHGPVEVGEHQDAEKFGAGSGAERVEACPKSAFQLIRPHGLKATLTGAAVVSSVRGGTVNWLMRLSLVIFVVSLSVWGVIAVWQTVRVYELMRTWQIIAVSLAVVSGLVMLALLVNAAWERLRR